jgi:hypothetical protein
MKYATALKFYGTGLAIAAALNIKPQAIYQWKARGVVPIKSALALQGHSRGKVKVDPSVYAKRGPKPDVRAALPG